MHASVDHRATPARWRPAGRGSVGPRRLRRRAGGVVRDGVQVTESRSVNAALNGHVVQESAQSVSLRQGTRPPPVCGVRRRTRDAVPDGPSSSCQSLMRRVPWDAVRRCSRTGPERQAVRWRLVVTDRALQGLAAGRITIRSMHLLLPLRNRRRTWGCSAREGLRSTRRESVTSRRGAASHVVGWYTTRLTTRFCWPSVANSSGSAATRSLDPGHHARSGTSSRVVGRSMTGGPALSDPAGAVGAGEDVGVCVVCDI